MKKYDPLLESSWSRIIQHVEDPKSKFAIISPFVYPYGYVTLPKNIKVENHEKNRDNYRNLKNEVRAKGYGYIPQKGGYTYEDENNDSELVHELSMLIYGIEYNDAITFGIKLNQESILYKNPEIGFILVYTKNFIDVNGNKHNIHDIGMKFKMKKNSNNKITFDPKILKYAYSQLVKGSKSQTSQKFAYISEAVYPTRTDCILKNNCVQFKKIA